MVIEVRNLSLCCGPDSWRCYLPKISFQTMPHNEAQFPKSHLGLLPNIPRGNSLLRKSLHASAQWKVCWRFRSDSIDRPKRDSPECTQTQAAWMNGKWKQRGWMANWSSRLTTKASDTTKRTWAARVPSALLTARTISRNGGFCPDKSASELPAPGTVILWLSYHWRFLISYTPKYWQRRCFPSICKELWVQIGIHWCCMTCC